MDPNEDLDDEFKPTKIHIPKVDPKGSYSLFINKTQAYETGINKITVVLKKHEFDGFVIPHGTVITIPYMHESSSGSVPILGTELNLLLKRLFFEQLRTVKKKK